MDSALCIALVAGNLLHALPSPSVTLTWIHSVERTAWQEDYVVEGAQLRLREARVKSSGAGMDPPSHATWSNGWWSYAPSLDRMPEVVLANSQFVGGYSICLAHSRCRPLEETFPKGTPVRIVVHPCPGLTGAGE